jgi:hypothetical protein
VSALAPHLLEAYREHDPLSPMQVRYHPVRITSTKQALKIRGVGKSSAQIIQLVLDRDPTLQAALAQEAAEEAARKEAEKQRKAEARKAAAAERKLAREQERRERQEAARQAPSQTPARLPAAIAPSCTPPTAGRLAEGGLLLGKRSRKEAFSPLTDGAVLMAGWSEVGLPV